jgi:hypothetical protein
MLRMFNDQIADNRKPFLEILLFSSPSSSCSKIEKHLLETIEKRKFPIKVTTIDVLRTPEAAEKHNIIACPTVIFRDFMRVYGNCERAELEELVLKYSSLSSSELQHQSVFAPVGSDDYV